ncbi:MAG: pentapeptide repeat-containing protein [bacterium]
MANLAPPVPVAAAVHAQLVTWGWRPINAATRSFSMSKGHLVTIFLSIFSVGCENVPPDTRQRLPVKENSTPDTLNVEGPSVEPERPALDRCTGQGCDGVWLIESPCVYLPYLLEVREVAFGGDEHPLIGLIEIEDLPSAIAQQLPNGYSPMIYVARQGKVVDFQWTAYSHRNNDGLDDNIQKIRNLMARTAVVRGNPSHFQKKMVGILDPADALLDLSALDLSGHDFINRRMQGVNLSGSNLTNAKLRESNLAGAFLRYTDLTGADISGVDFTNATFLNTICPDGTRTDEGCAGDD